jgi:hypothetical protein
MRGGMTLSFSGLAAAICACSTSWDTFHIQDAQHLVQSATVSICHDESVLARRGDDFRGQVKIDCEGAGFVRLAYKDGTIHDCPIGYVTSLHQDWNFRALPGGCQPVP